LVIFHTKKKIVSGRGKKVRSSSEVGSIKEDLSRQEGGDNEKRGDEIKLEKQGKSGEVKHGIRRSQGRKYSRERKNGCN